LTEPFWMLVSSSQASWGEVIDRAGPSGETIFNWESLFSWDLDGPSNDKAALGMFSHLKFDRLHERPAARCASFQAFAGMNRDGI